MKKILVTVAGGGHRFQSISLLSQIADKVELELLCPEGSMPPKDDILKQFNVTYVSDFNNISQTGKYFSRFIGLFKAIFEARKIIKKTQPDLVIGIGTYWSVPLLTAARLTATKGIFIESITRVTSPSTTGKILSRLFIANYIYVQWPESVKMYKNAIFKGNVL